MIELIIKYTGDIEAAAERLGAGLEILSPSIAILTIDEAAVPLLLDIPQIEYYEAPKNVALFMAESLYHACIPEARENFGLRGDGVIVALLDSGIDYTHPDFRNADGTTRIIALWDMTASGTPPEGFRNGHLFTADEINAALLGASPALTHTDYIGHGTAVAGVATGNGRASEGKETGVAPNASIIAVKLGHPGREAQARTIELMRGLKFVADYAARENKPVAINISYGTNEGSHDGSSLFEQYINEIASRPRITIIAAAGNEGVAGHHYFGQLATRQSDAIYFNISGGVFSMYMVILKDFADNFTFRITSPTGQTTNVIRNTARPQVFGVDGGFIWANMGIPTHYNVNQEIYIRFDGDGEEITPGLWRLDVFSQETVADGAFHAWLPTTEEVTIKTAFSGPNPNGTITMPATADGVIAVGAYNAAFDAAAEFSGRGITVYKPDIVAPGVNIISARAGGGYDSFTGTSVAAPFVTGAVALLMEWGIVKNNAPDLYGEKIKAFLRAGATRRAFRNYPNNIWGYGALCLRDTLNRLTEVQS